MAIKISNTTVVNNSRQLQNIASIDTTTRNTINANVTTMSQSGARISQSAAGPFQVGHYAALRAIANGPFVYGNTYTGSNLAACDFGGLPYHSGGTVYIVGGSWRCHGYTFRGGTLSTSEDENQATLWIRYA